MIRIFLAVMALFLVFDTGFAQMPARRIAVTIDDLPGVSPQPVLPQQTALNARLIDALQKHAVPAVGFVNESKLYDDGVLIQGKVDLMRAWTAAGLELGNHTFAHSSLHSVPVDSFLVDIDRGDPVLRSVLAEVGREPRYFRHPYLHTGRSVDVRDQVHRHLEKRGYQVAPVTVDNNEYIFALAYYRAVQGGRSDEARRIGTDYIAYMDSMLAYYEQQSTALLGYELPQILLIHENMLNADYGDRLFTTIERRGYRFVTLEAALQDPAYRSSDTFIGPSGITWLHRWAITQGKKGAFFGHEPGVPAWIQVLAE